MRYSGPAMQAQNTASRPTKAYPFAVFALRSMKTARIAKLQFAVVMAQSISYSTFSSYRSLSTRLRARPRTADFGMLCR